MPFELGGPSNKTLDPMPNDKTLLLNVCVHVCEEGGGATLPTLAW